MKNQKQTNLFIRSSLTLALAFAFLSPLTSQSADPADPAAPAEDTASEGKMMEHCKKMMEQKEQMKADRQAQNTELTEQAARMNSAPAEKKVDEMAALITKMLEQRIAMDERKAKMEEGMMEHMREHMETGKDSLSMCPMMKTKGHKMHHEKAN